MFLSSKVLGVIKEVKNQVRENTAPTNSQRAIKSLNSKLQKISIKNKVKNLDSQSGFASKVQVSDSTQPSSQSNPYSVSSVYRGVERNEGNGSGS